MSTHKPDDDREFEAFLKGDHQLSHEYHREADDAVPDSLDAMILRQAAEQAARQQRLNEPAVKAPWYRQSWFAPASGIAIAAMVTVVMFYPAQVPLQQSEPARMQELALEEAPVRKMLQAPAAPESVEADSAAALDMAAASAPAPVAAMHDAVGNMAAATESERRADVASAEAGMLEAKAMQVAPASVMAERQLAKREKPAPQAIDPDWALSTALQAGDWLAAAAYLDALPSPMDEGTTALVLRMRAAVEHQQIPEANDLNALYDWLQAHHPEAIHHDGQATTD
ncbi:MAG: hypothetical protein EP312_00105 [Gammaproteobacteria bacterium]|nr:MAG: hypothetical protein EP312_00105 [Gammaproteobacteria bacterium]